ncbi:cytochrome c biogenesis protein ResB [Demequina aestuarii]|uniref:cytochrome c biogenesis protein ResB n=1 Tax=Demequina aestuarii TaxID=327095 RepID=UPI0007846F93|nr:cytochrome c biogenesis protein ResB [Demequina aestuarii]
MARMRIDNYAYAEVPRLGWRGWLRWMWRQVTSMRVALILLLMLALAAIPGSVLPQWPQDAGNTRGFVEANPFWGPLLDRMGFLDVFGSAWFTAIYLLLFASLIGCIVPRCLVYWHDLRAPVPAAPSRLDRFEPVTVTAHKDARAVVWSARQALSPGTFVSRPGERIVLRRPRWWRWFADYRIRVDERPGRAEDASTEVALSAHKGHVRELGNLIFHVSLVGILIAVAAGTLLTYRGQALIVEGDTFTNAVVAYDSYESGSLFSEDSLEPWTLSLDQFEAVFGLDGNPDEFTAYTTLTEPGREPRPVEAQVNRPIQVDGAKIYLQGNGYAPVFTVTDSAGNVAFEGAVPFLPQDAVYTSTGVVKVPDVTEGEQLGFSGTLLPTALIDGDSASSLHPSPTNPVIFLEVFSGDLGLDDGVPQNVYALDESQLSPVRGEDDEPLVVALEPGETIELPQGLGSITWESLPRFAAFDLRRDPSLPWLLGASIGALAGLTLSLFGTRRRLWLVAPMGAGAGAETTVVTAAAWAPAHDGGVREDLEKVLIQATGTLTRKEDS